MTSRACSSPTSPRSRRARPRGALTPSVPSMTGTTPICRRALFARGPSTETAFADRLRALGVRSLRRAARLAGPPSSCARGTRPHVEDGHMLRAFSRYGARVVPNTEQIIEAAARRNQLIEGPAIARFESRFAERFGGGTAVSASCGRMACLYILRALALPPGSEIVFPAAHLLGGAPRWRGSPGSRRSSPTWTPQTFCLDPDSFEARRSTHAPAPSYRRISTGCRRHDRITMDCGAPRPARDRGTARTRSATYRGRSVGTFGGCGSSVSRRSSRSTLRRRHGARARPPARRRGDRPVAGGAVADRGRGEPDLLLGKVAARLRAAAHLTSACFPLLWRPSWIHAGPTSYLWESIARSIRCRTGTARRYRTCRPRSASKASITTSTADGRSRAHAARLDRALATIPGLSVPARPGDREHVFYQYCFYAPDRDEFVGQAIRRRLDVETMHMDVCADLPLFVRRRCAGARQAARPCSCRGGVARRAEMEEVIERIGPSRSRLVRTPARAAPVASADVRR